MCLALTRHGVDHTIVRWIRVTLEGRLVTAALGSVSRSFAVSRGCPQVGVLSPLLWCLIVDELLVRLNEGSVYVQGYGDDICLLVMVKFPNTVSGLIQFIPLNCGVPGSACRLIPTRPSLLHSLERGNLQGSLSPACLGRP